jgi:hypothetical protein
MDKKCARDGEMLGVLELKKEFFPRFMRGTRLRASPRHGGATLFSSTDFFKHSQIRRGGVPSGAAAIVTIRIQISGAVISLTKILSFET